MRIFCFLAAFLAVLALQGADFFPNGEFREPRGFRPDIGVRGKGRVLRPGTGLVLEMSSGGVEVNYHKRPAPEAGKRLYVLVPFEVFELLPGVERRVSARIFFYDREGKHLGKLNQFPVPVLPKEPGKYDLFFSVVIPKDVAKVTFSFWFGGLKKARVERFSGTFSFPADPATGNLILNGGLETPAMASFYFRGVSKTPLRTLERSTDKAKTGRWSLRSFCEDPKRGTEINFNSLPFTPGKKYRFSSSYFVASREGKSTVTGRVMFMDAKGKVIRYLFPAFEDSPGKWHEMNLSFFPPVNCARVALTVWLSGKQTVHLDDFYYGIVEEKTLENRSAGAVKLKESAECVLWKEAPYLKVPASGIPEKVNSGTTVQLAAAANESEPFQIVVSARKTLDDVTLAFTPLKGLNRGIPASAITFRRVGFVNLKNPENPAMKGLNADPLLPEQKGTAEKGRNLPFFVVVAVPAGTPAGIYEGEGRVLAGTKELGKFTLKLRVFDFELPATPHLRTYFYILAHPAYNVWDKRSYAEKAENFHKLIQDHRMTGNQAQWLPAPVWKIENGNLVVTDWSKFDAQAERRIKVYGQRNLPVPILTMKGDNDGWFAKDKKLRDKPGKSPFGNFNLISPEGLKYAGQYAKQFCAHVKEKFPGIDFFAYIYDEPPAKVHADLKVLLDSLHAAAPELKILIPKLVTDTIGYVHTFCVPFAPGYYHPEEQAAHMKKGGDVWYYNWAVRMSNHDYILNRLYAWRIYAGKGSGGLLWCTNWTYKDVNPWTDFERTGYNCGGATIFYPPRKAGEGCISSQRAAMIRESIDDFDYMRILENLIDKTYPGVGRVRVMEILKALIPVPPFEYVNDPHLLYRLRLELAEEIEAFKKFPAAVVSTPSCSSKVEVSTVKFKVFAPAGTKVAIDGKAAGTVGSKVLEIPFTLGKIGVNKVRIVLACGGKSRTVERTFELAADPRLKELASLIGRAGRESADAREASALLARVKEGRHYTEKERAQAAGLVGKLKYALVDRALKADRAFVNPLERFFFRRARQVFTWKLFERSEYYLALAAEAARAGKMENFKVKVTPTVFKDHPALCFDNGIIQAVILETGGTVVSFKVGGTETLVPGNFSRILSAEQRAAQKVTRDMITQLGGYNGFTDAGGGGIWPIAFTDWNVTLRRLSSDRAAVTFSAALPGTSFVLKRTVSMKSNSPDLVMDYEITNLMPPDAASDDPEHIQLAWRGRFVPAIGSGVLPQADDVLVVPVKYGRDKLEQSCFDLKKPVFFERRSVRLTKPFLGVWDRVLHKGLAIIGTPVTSHAYVWFNSKGDHKGGNKVYTLEFPRSFFGKKYDDAEPNRPLTVRPGKTLNFSITLRGLVNVKDDADLIRQAGF